MITQDTDIDTGIGMGHASVHAFVHTSFTRLDAQVREEHRQRGRIPRPAAQAARADGDGWGKGGADGRSTQE